MVTMVDEYDDKRDNQRLSLVDPLRVKVEGKNALAVNLSTRGLFATGNNLNRHVGERIKCQLTLSPHKSVDVDCRVMWVRHDTESSEGNPPGVGLQFEDITSTRYKDIEIFVEHLKIDGSSAFLMVDPFAESGTWAPDGLTEGLSVIRPRELSTAEHKPIKTMSARTKTLLILTLGIFIGLSAAALLVFLAR